MPPDLVAPAESKPKPASEAPPQGVQASQQKPAPAAQTTSTAPPKGKKRGRKPEPEPVPAPAPEPPAPVVPPTPQQMAPTPPRVTYGDGMLSITANNSTMADVLAAIRARTGANIQIPPGAGNERVFAQIGPATPRDALTALLTGSAFDYVIVGTPEDPDALQQVLLTMRSADGSSPGMNAAPVNEPYRTRLPGMSEAPQTTTPATTNDEPEEEKPQAQTPPPANAQPAQPTGQAPVQPPGQTGSATSNPPQPQQKTPEQLLEELNRMKQQQQAPAAKKPPQ